MLLRISIVLLSFVLLVLWFVRFAGQGGLGEHEGPGVVTTTERDPAIVAEGEARVRRAAEEIGVVTPRQILFGDLHVHTTFSFDAFMLSLPMQQGEGTHPPADACDFARFCSGLDFWSINDHAEGISPQNWAETVDSIRQCNAVAGDASMPDTVAFLGWEWTQVGDAPSDHFGHKNVVLAHTDDARIPARPIAATSTVRRTRAFRVPPLALGAAALWSGADRMHDLALYLDQRANLEICPVGVPVRDLPLDCLETAETPRDLFDKLDDWGHDAIVIPHGTTWGFYTPPGSTWDKQLRDHDPQRETLLEIYSGHGNSDVYRDWRALRYDEAGNAVCPEPTPGYLPTCWRAGEIIRERCLAAGESDAECEDRAVTARQHAADAGHPAHLTVPGAVAEEWLDSGQCIDCQQGAFNYRPGGSAQYVMALSDFADPERPKRFRMGFMASSDNHFARPGTGYKEVHRMGFTESRDRRPAGSGLRGSALFPESAEPVARSNAYEPGSASGFALFELERQASYFMTGGLVAAHSEGRDRDAIWQALGRREVYGTSGPRILLWFDLVNSPGTSGVARPMGSEVEMADNPIFQVRAVGSFEQKPGCPADTLSALGADRLRSVCKGECYHPTDVRRRIDRIEVVRVRPQAVPGEAVAPLIEDPWRTFECEPQSDGCAVTFEDPDFATAGRDTLYYVRAIEPEAPGINAAGVNCERDAKGRCVAPRLCSDPTSDCLAPQEPKAWSSPIFVDYSS